KPLGSLRRSKMHSEMSSARCRFSSRRFVAMFLLTLSTMLAVSLPGYTADQNKHWVATWSTTLHQPQLAPGLANAGFNNQTLRQIVHTSIGGRQVRVRFSTFGTGA